MTLAKEGFEIEQAINFGCPRIGDKKYAEFTVKTIPNQWRMTHHKDPCPHVPPQIWPFDFHHIATEVYEDKNEAYTVCDGSGEDNSCSNQFYTYKISEHLVYMDQCMGVSCGYCTSGGNPVSSVLKEDVWEEEDESHLSTIVKSQIEDFDENVKEIWSEIKPDIKENQKKVLKAAINEMGLFFN